ncbi:SWIM zinc finger family protein [Tessaracoccus caeni]|uniref:SWIM zinc finger family protein n=1 Tax=Tessaracoccus caeni TaxID=3031239 RepID=UPI0023DA9EF6|nr:SWIM zinc finger family protein [Tessaracoccus caeni]MDF1487857.1 SWIM zinc finger family protein [Tessaracoccus caeni]
MTVTYAWESIADDRSIELATSMATGPSGLVDSPHFFSGFVVDAEECARGILAVANVAATSYYSRIDWSSLDPVVTSDGERLRFESFSGCGGVYARFDLTSLDGELGELGTTNIDVNPPLRHALSTIRSGEPLHLSVGRDAVTATTKTETHVERKVKLPDRWVRGFGEASVACATMHPLAELGAIDALRFLRSLPPNGRRIWVVPSGRTLRLSATASAGAVYLDGAHRLAELLPLLRFTTALRIYGPTDGGSEPRSSAWQLVLPTAHLTLVLSPDVARGFSGEGGVLRDLATGDAHDADAVLDVLAWTPGAGSAELALALGWDEPRVRRTLTRLGTSGRVGFDNADGRFFHRDLPYDADKAARRNPRLVAAQRLVEEGAITLENEAATVRSGASTYRLRRTDGGWLCGCDWGLRHGTSRGPCKHGLAVELSA